MDKAQVHEYCERQIERNYNEVGVNEGKWIIERYKNYTVHLINPETHTTSIYSYGAKDGGKRKIFKKYPIILILM
jgi:hypothetical protein